jgi:very-short-patch-repair endonuclease
MPRTIPTGWDVVRALCRFYHDCLELEAGSKAVYEVGTSEIEGVQLGTSLDWARLASGKSVAIPANEGVFALVRGAEENRLRLAGPLDVVVRNRKRLLLPPFLLTVVAARRQGSIELRIESGPRINESWLKERFSRSSAEKRDELLIRLGFVVEEDLGDGEVPSIRPSAGLRLDELWSRLLVVDAERVREDGDARRIVTNGDWTQLTSDGIHNRLLLLPAATSPFLAGAMAELRHIADRPDVELQRTALAAFFSPLLGEDAPGDTTPEVVARTRPEFEPLNGDQRTVVEAALTRPITSVQGPPGTGKSLTVTHVLLTHALSGRSALFASRNHRALEAVVPRIQSIDPDHPLVLRLTQALGDSSDGEVDWVRWVLDRLAVPANEQAKSELQAAIEKLHESLAIRDALEREANDQAVVVAQLAEANEAIRQAEGATSPAWFAVLPKDAAELARWARRILQLTARESQENWWLRDGLDALRVRWVLWRLARRWDAASLAVPRDRSARRILLRVLGRWAEATSDRKALELRAAGSEDRAELLGRLGAADAAIKTHSARALEALARAGGSHLREEDRSIVASLRGELGRSTTAGRIHRLNPRQKSLVAQLLRAALDIVPLWACSSLSARSRLPLVPGAFDLAVIDEASQCDIASSIPILYRARRVLVVGDPQQLRHVAMIGREAEERLRNLHALDEVAIGAYLHSSNSVWEPAAEAARRYGTGAVLLREHWRCHPAIAEYFSSLFYGGQLRVRTPLESIPPVVRAGRQLRGIEWTHVDGGSESVPGGSRYWQPQIDAIVDELQRVETSGFDGTVGVVTPFRAHADRIRDAATGLLSQRTLERWRFESQTADGFQGDERDLVLFGLVGGPSDDETPPFYARDRNRFNVAVSRARGLLHVFGDRDWASRSQLDTLRGLHEAWSRCQQQVARPLRTDLIGPVWEPRFASALRKAGIDFQQQYPACGFYLDFAIIRGSSKLAVEVDGESYHRDAKGKLRIEDVRRDLILKAAGWQVERFWVYQLRENLDGCIERVRTVLRES